jgi:hypothetical protein
VFLGWLARILQSNVADCFRDGEEIRRLIEAFLSARAAALPMPRFGPAIPTEESQDWEDFDIDVNDPAILALVDGRQSPPRKQQILDLEAAKVNKIGFRRQSANYFIGYTGIIVSDV